MSELLVIVLLAWLSGVNFECFLSERFFWWKWDSKPCWRYIYGCGSLSRGSTCIGIN